jgi:hypothetical protein
MSVLMWPCVRTQLNSDAELIMRTLGISHRIGGSPALARRAGI